MEKDKKGWSALGGVGVAVGGAFSLLPQKSVLDVMQTQYGEIEQVKASTCLKDIED